MGGTSLAYDTNGNLTSDGTNTYLYDIENRLVSVSGQNSASLRYDPLGRLHEIADGGGNLRRNLYDGDALIAEYGPGSTSPLLRRFVHGVAAGDDPLVTYEGPVVSLSAARFLHRDRLGSIVMQADQNGADVETWAYDEYGVHGSNAPDRFGYTGQVWVPEAGLYYYKARMYSPSLGRFMQADPIGYGDGMNIYEYVGGDPVNFIDPTGLEIVVIAGCKKGETPVGPPDEAPHACLSPDELSRIFRQAQLSAGGGTDGGSPSPQNIPCESILCVPEPEPCNVRAPYACPGQPANEPREPLCPNLSWSEVGRRTLQGTATGFATGIGKFVRRWEFYASAGAAAGAVAGGVGAAPGAADALVAGAIKDIGGSTLTGTAFGAAAGIHDGCKK